MQSFESAVQDYIRSFGYITMITYYPQLVLSNPHLNPQERMIFAHVDTLHSTCISSYEILELKCNPPNSMTNSMTIKPMQVEEAL
jgi:hypothetical protein